MKLPAITIYTVEGLVQVAKVKDGIAYDVKGETIDEKVFGSTKHRVLQLDGEFEINENPTISHLQMMEYRSQALDIIKNDPEAWAKFKNPTAPI